MRDWVADKFAYTPGVSDATTTALDSFVMRRGICRDYAHVMVALARASTIPARFVSCYAPGVEPPDFHAVAEVFLADPETPGGGAWYLVDATGMADPGEIAKIGVGRDAADVSFLTSFGMVEFVDKTVSGARGVTSLGLVVPLRGRGRRGAGGAAAGSAIGGRMRVVRLLLVAVAGLLLTFGGAAAARDGFTVKRVLPIDGPIRYGEWFWGRGGRAPRSDGRAAGGDGRPGGAHRQRVPRRLRDRRDPRRCWARPSTRRLSAPSRS